jgi:ABC-type branched-subunit amino acid transport system permease subunit
LLKEYEEANRYAMHLNTLNWQLGSILIGGSLAALAGGLVVIAQSSQRNVVLVPVFVALVAIVALLSWLLFIKRNGDFSEITVCRMVEIERALGLTFQQHIQEARYRGQTFVGQRPLRLSGPRGFHIALFLVLGIVILLSLLIAYIGYIWFG